MKLITSLTVSFLLVAVAIYFWPERNGLVPISHDIQSVLPDAPESIQVASQIVERAHAERVPVVNAYMEAIVVALRQYYSNFGNYPTGTWREISGALQGQNNTQIVFIEGYGWTNNSGELSDPWGEPFKVAVDTEIIRVRSAGPNRVFDDDDDKVYEKPTRH